jgi:hypothetical protein
LDELSKNTSKSGSRSVMASGSNALDRTGGMMEGNSKIPLFPQFFGNECHCHGMPQKQLPTP